MTSCTSAINFLFVLFFSILEFSHRNKNANISLEFHGTSLSILSYFVFFLFKYVKQSSFIIHVHFIHRCFFFLLFQISTDQWIADNFFVKLLLGKTKLASNNEWKMLINTMKNKRLFTAKGDNEKLHIFKKLISSTAAIFCWKNHLNSKVWWSKT